MVVLIKRKRERERGTRGFIYASMSIGGWGPGTHIAASAYPLFFSNLPEKRHHCVVSRFLDRPKGKAEDRKKSWAVHLFVIREVQGRNMVCRTDTFLEVSLVVWSDGEQRQRGSGLIYTDRVCMVVKGNQAHTHTHTHTHIERVSGILVSRQKETLVCCIFVFRQTFGEEVRRNSSLEFE
jgi:hypothetical protein